MFSLNGSNRFFLYPHPTDMRKSFYTLGGIVTSKMHMDVQDGDAFVFVNRELTTMKVLHVECGGLVIYYLKLEKGRLVLPDSVFSSESQSMETSWTDIVMMVEGISLDGSRKAKRWTPDTSPK